MTATSGAPSWSSASVISRPIHGCTPRVRKKFPETSCPLNVSTGGLRSCAPDAERSIACLQGCEVNELRRMLAEVLVGLPGEERKSRRRLPCVYPPQLQQRILSPIRHNSSGFVTGSDLSITWCTSVKMAVVAPIPRANVITTVAANPGERRSCRKECFKSPTIYSRPPPLHRERLEQHTERHDRFLSERLAPALNARFVRS